MQIDQAGLAAGTPGRARTDGLDDGSLVTVTSTGSGTSHTVRLLWVPPEDTTAVSSLTQTTSTTWTFAPTAGVYGSYRIELIVDEGQLTESREVRIFGIRTMVKSLLRPALNERASAGASLLNRGQEIIDASENNEFSAGTPLGEIDYGGWWKGQTELIDVVETLAAGSGENNAGANLPGGDVFVYTGKVGVDLQFRSIRATNGIVVDIDGGIAGTPIRIQPDYPNLVPTQGSFSGVSLSFGAVTDSQVLGRSGSNIVGVDLYNQTVENAAQTAFQNPTLRFVGDGVASITNAAGQVTEVDISGGADPIYTQARSDQGEPNGFVDVADSDVSFIGLNALIREFSIRPTVGGPGTYRVWLGGTYLDKTTLESVTWTDVEGLHFFYFDNAGTLQHTTDESVVPGVILGDGAFVHALYWDATAKAVIFTGEERHGLMDGKAHLHFHQGFGAQWYSGGGIGNLLTDQSGDLDSHAQMSVGDVQYADEDIAYRITNGSPQTLGPILQAPVYWLTGAGNWRKKTATNFPFIESGSTVDSSGTVYTGASGRPAYNQLGPADTWQLTEVGNNDYFLTHILASNNVLGRDSAQTNISGEPIIAIAGQQTYGSISEARAGADSELLSLANLAELLAKELVPLGTVIYQAQDNDSNSVKCHTISVDGTADYVDWRETRIGDASASAGEANTARNLAAEGVFAQKVGAELQFKGIESQNASLAVSSDFDTVNLTVNASSTAASGTGNAGTIGTSDQLARADHVHEQSYYRSYRQEVGSFLTQRRFAAFGNGTNTVASVTDDVANSWTLVKFNLSPTITGITYLANSSEYDHGTFGSLPSTIDFVNGQKGRCTLSGSAAITLAFPGVGNYTLRIIQDATGSRLPDFQVSGGDVYAAGGVLNVSTAANSVTVMSIYFDGTNAWASTVPGATIATTTGV